MNVTQTTKKISYQTGLVKPGNLACGNINLIVVEYTHCGKPIG